MKNTVKKNRRKRRIIYILALVVFILGAMGIRYIYIKQNQPKEIIYRNDGTTNLDNADWKLVWSDEFEGDSLNLDYWTYDEGKDKWGNEEEEYYTVGDNLSVEDGCLVITARYDADNEENPYTSSRIITREKVSFSYGKIEAKIKLPSGQGIWPAFWMMGNANNYTWPACGEIDIMEAINVCDVTYGNIHWGHKDRNGQGINGYQNIADGGWSKIENPAQWHVFGIEWNKNEIRWLLDDNVYYTFLLDKKNEDQKVFEEPFYLLLNVAVGGNWTGAADESIFPQSMYVDYVRVYDGNAEE